MSNKPQIVKDSKYELELEEIDINDAVHLQAFNFKRDYDHPDNKAAREVWRTTKQRKHEPAFKPLPKTIALEKVKLGDIVTIDATKVKEKQYKVISKVELEGVPHVEAIAIYNAEMKTLVGKTSFLKHCYLVPQEDIQIDEQFKEEVLTEDVNIYVPNKEKPVIKKSKHRTNGTQASLMRPTPLVQLCAGDIVHRNVGDSVYEIIGMARKEGDLYAECRLIESTNRPNHIGNVYFFNNDLYLTEEKKVTAA